jgi:hypothetical protein
MTPPGSSGLAVLPNSAAALTTMPWRMPQVPGQASKQTSQRIGGVENPQADQVTSQQQSLERRHILL